MRIYFCTTPKAGSQWFRDLMNHDLLLPHVPWRHREHELWQLDVHADRWLDDGEDGLFFGPLYNVAPRFVLRHVRPEDRVIGLFRDPRDVAVSWMYSALYSHGASPPIDLMRPVLAALPAGEQLRVAIYFAVDFSRTQAYWYQPLPDNFQRTSYEDLIADTPAVLSKLLHFLGAKVPDGVLQRVCDELSFKASSGGRKPGSENVFSHHRKGISGDWRNHFDRETGRVLESFKPGLLRRLGYESDNDWWQRLPRSVRPSQATDAQPAAGAISVLEAKVGALTEKLRTAESVAAERLQVIDTLQTAADERLQVIGTLKDIADERSKVIQDLKQAADERLQALQRLAGNGSPA